MRKERAEELYGSILDTAQQIRQEITNEFADILPFGGKIPDASLSELAKVADITGIVFDALASKGVEMTPIENKPEFMSLTIDGKTYMCHQSAISSFKSEENTNSAPSPIKEPAPVVSNPLPEEKPEVVVQPAPVPTPAPQPIVVNPVPVVPEIVQPIPVAEPVSIATESNEVEPFVETVVSEPESVPAFEPTVVAEPEPVAEEIFAETVTNSWTQYAEEASNKSEEISDEDAINAIVAEEIEKEKVPAPVPFETSSIGQISKADLFLEEKRKPGNEFIFDTYNMTVSHMGSKAEDMQVMIAPLKVQRFQCPSAPIVVSIYYKGRIYTKSSYDIVEEGKNLVTIDVNEYYFLCRGAFDENGNFQSSIVTTGFSASQGDKINVLARKKNGNTSNAKNGHIKFKYQTEEGPGTLEVFPLEIGANDFVIISKNDEFVDYLSISGRGLNKAIVYELGQRKEVVCNWDGDFLETELVEV